jgi:hypothetical protein
VHGFCLVIEKICGLYARDQGFAVAFRSAFPNAMDFAAGREYAVKSVAELVRRAKDAGYVRPEFVLDDLIFMIMANDGIHTTSPATWAAASRRFTALAIQAFQAPRKPRRRGGRFHAVAVLALVAARPPLGAGL